MATNDDIPHRERDPLPLSAESSTNAQDDSSTHSDSSATDKVDGAIMTPIEPEDVGMTVGQKVLYSTKEDENGNYQWTAEMPTDLLDPAEDAETAKWALLIRRRRAYFDSKKTLELDSIVIQSPHIRELLGEVLADYPGVTTTLKRLEFSGRFQPLIHRWSQLKAFIAKLNEEQSKRSNPSEADCAKVEHANLLDKVLTDEFTEVLDSVEDMHKNGVVTYEHLWALVEPDSLIYTKHDSQERIMHVKSCKYFFDQSMGCDVFNITVNFVDFDGQRFGMNRMNVKIPDFEGTKPITSLAAYPIKYHEKVETLKTSLIERGGRVEDLAGSHFRQYDGVGWTYDMNMNKVQVSVKGRVVLDAGGFNKFNPNFAVRVTPLKEPKSNMGRDFRTGLPMFEDDIEDREEYTIRRVTRLRACGGFFADLHDTGRMPINGSLANEMNVDDLPPLTDEQKMLLGPEIRGYAFKEKQWLTLFVNAVSDITFSDSAYDSLILPPGKKELIMCFSSSKQNGAHNFDDVIKGKGNGIIILLCGPPGVGKTLTAESVAERMEVPLFMMSSGDLGTDPSSVEAKLRNVLEMCTRWNAILLIDEADVFLEKRSLHELERNKLVTIFLRMLEYYEGIMFLTTNRVETFDPAFQSRIHISLEYKDLDYKSRLSIWNNFLLSHNTSQAAARLAPPKPLSTAAKSHRSARNLLNSATTAAGGPPAPLSAEEAAKLHPDHALTENQVRRLAELQVNGREIKNLLKIGQLMASYKKEALKYEDVEKAVEATQFAGNARREGEKVRAGIFN